MRVWIVANSEHYVPYISNIVKVFTTQAAAEIFASEAEEHDTNHTYEAFGPFDVE